MNGTTSSRTSTFTGKHMFVIMLMFFGTIISVNALMATIAGSSWTGLIVKNSYVASQGFNDKIVKARQQNSRGWKSQLIVGAGKLTVTLQDKDAKPLNGMKFSGFVYRPVAEGQERELTFQAVGEGSYQAEARLRPGIWELSINGSDRTNQSYRKVYRFIVKDGLS